MTKAHIHMQFISDSESCLYIYKFDKYTFSMIDNLICYGNDFHETFPSSDKTFFF